MDHLPKDRDVLLEREFQRVTISGEETCGVRLPEAGQAGNKDLFKEGQNGNFSLGLQSNAVFPLR